MVFGEFATFACGPSGTPAPTNRFIDSLRAAAFAAASKSLGDFNLVSLLRQEVLVHVVDVVTGEFSLEVAVLAEGTDETTAVDAAPVLHIPPCKMEPTFL